MRLTKQGLLKAAGKPVSGEAVEAIFKAYSSKAMQNLSIRSSMFIPAATRSGAAGYSATYRALKAQGYTDEKANEVAIGAGLMQGAVTGLLVVGMGAIGRGGFEDLALAGATPRQIATTLKGLSRTSGITNEALVTSMQNAFKTSLKAAQKQGGFFKGTVKGAVDEGIEEGLDQFINSFVSDAWSNKDTPLWDNLAQTLNAAALGAVFGAAVPAGRAGIARGRRFFNDASVDAGIRASIQNDYINEVVADLESSGNPMTAQAVRQEMITAARFQEAQFDGPARRLREVTASERAKAVQASERASSQTQEDLSRAEDIGKNDQDTIAAAEARAASVEKAIPKLVESYEASRKVADEAAAKAAAEPTKSNIQAQIRTAKAAAKKAATLASRRGEARNIRIKAAQDFAARSENVRRAAQDRAAQRSSSGALEDAFLPTSNTGERGSRPASDFKSDVFSKWNVRVAEKALNDYVGRFPENSVLTEDQNQERVRLEQKVAEARATQQAVSKISPTDARTLDTQSAQHATLTKKAEKAAKEAAEASSVSSEAAQRVEEAHARLADLLQESVDQAEIKAAQKVAEAAAKEAEKAAAIEDAAAGKLASAEGDAREAYEKLYEELKRVASKQDVSGLGQPEDPATIVRQLEALYVQQEMEGSLDTDIPDTIRAALTKEARANIARRQVFVDVRNAYTNYQKAIATQTKAADALSKANQQLEEATEELKELNEAEEKNDEAIAAAENAVLLATSRQKRANEVFKGADTLMGEAQQALSDLANKASEATDAMAGAESRTVDGGSGFQIEVSVVPDSELEQERRADLAAVINETLSKMNNTEPLTDEELSELHNALNELRIRSEADAARAVSTPLSITEAKRNLDYAKANADALSKVVISALVNPDSTLGALSLASGRDALAEAMHLKAKAQEAYDEVVNRSLGYARNPSPDAPFVYEPSFADAKIAGMAMLQQLSDGVYEIKTTKIEKGKEVPVKGQIMVTGTDTPTPEVRFVIDGKEMTGYTPAEFVRYPVVDRDGNGDGETSIPFRLGKRLGKASENLLQGKGAATQPRTTPNSRRTTTTTGSRPATPRAAVEPEAAPKPRLTPEELDENNVLGQEAQIDEMDFNGAVEMFKLMQKNGGDQYQAAMDLAESNQAKLEELQVSLDAAIEEASKARIAANAELKVAAPTKAAITRNKEKLAKVEEALKRIEKIKEAPEGEGGDFSADDKAKRVGQAIGKANKESGISVESEADLVTLKATLEDLIKQAEEKGAEKVQEGRDAQSEGTSEKQLIYRKKAKAVADLRKEIARLGIQVDRAKEVAKVHATRTAEAILSRLDESSILPHEVIEFITAASYYTRQTLGDAEYEALVEASASRVTRGLLGLPEDAEIGGDMAFVEDTIKGLFANGEIPDSAAIIEMWNQMVEDGDLPPESLDSGTSFHLSRLKNLSQEELTLQTEAIQLRKVAEELYADPNNEVSPSKISQQSVFVYPETDANGNKLSKPVPERLDVQAKKVAQRLEQLRGDEGEIELAFQAVDMQLRNTIQPEVLRQGHQLVKVPIEELADSEHLPEVIRSAYRRVFDRAEQQELEYNDRMQQQARSEAAAEENENFAQEFTNWEKENLSLSASETSIIRQEWVSLRARHRDLASARRALHQEIEAVESSLELAKQKGKERYSKNVTEAIEKLDREIANKDTSKAKKRELRNKRRKIRDKNAKRKKLAFDDKKDEKHFTELKEKLTSLETRLYNNLEAAINVDLGIQRVTYQLLRRAVRDKGMELGVVEDVWASAILRERQQFAEELEQRRAAQEEDLGYLDIESFEGKLRPLMGEGAAPNKFTEKQLKELEAKLARQKGEANRARSKVKTAQASLDKWAEKNPDAFTRTGRLSTKESNKAKADAYNKRKEFLTKATKTLAKAEGAVANTQHALDIATDAARKATIAAPADLDAVFKLLEDQGIKNADTEMNRNLLSQIIASGRVPAFSQRVTNARRDESDGAALEKIEQREINLRDEGNGAFGFDGGLITVAAQGKLAVALRQHIAKLYPPIPPNGTVKRDYASSVKTPIAYFDPRKDREGFNVRDENGILGARLQTPSGSKYATYEYGFVDEQGRGVFTNDPEEVKALLNMGIPVEIHLNEIAVEDINPAFELRERGGHLEVVDVRGVKPQVKNVLWSDTMVLEKGSLLRNTDRENNSSEQASAIDPYTTLSDPITQDRVELLSVFDKLNADSGKARSMPRRGVFIDELGKEHKNLPIDAGNRKASPMAAMTEGGHHLIDTVPEAIVKFYDFMANVRKAETQEEATAQQKEARKIYYAWIQQALRGNTDKNTKGLSPDYQDALYQIASVEVPLAMHLFGIRHTLLGGPSESNQSAVPKLYRVDVDGKGNVTVVAASKSKEFVTRRLRKAVGYFDLPESVVSDNSEAASQAKFQLLSLLHSVRGVEAPNPKSSKFDSPTKLNKELDQMITSVVMNGTAVTPNGFATSPSDAIKRTADRLRKHEIEANKRNVGHKATSMDGLEAGAVDLLTQGLDDSNLQTDSEGNTAAEMDTGNVQHPAEASPILEGRYSEDAPRYYSDELKLGPDWATSLLEAAQQEAAKQKGEETPSGIDSLAPDERGVVPIPSDAAAVLDGLDASAESKRENFDDQKKAIPILLKALDVDLTTMMADLPEKGRKALAELYVRAHTDKRLIDVAYAKLPEAGPTDAKSQAAAVAAQNAISRSEGMSNMELFSSLAFTLSTRTTADPILMEFNKLLRSESFQPSRDLQGEVLKLNPALQVMQLIRLSRVIRNGESISSDLAGRNALLAFKRQLEILQGGGGDTVASSSDVYIALKAIVEAFADLDIANATSYDQRAGRAMAFHQSNSKEIQSLGLVTGDSSSVIGALEQLRASDNANHRMVADMLLQDTDLIKSTDFSIINDPLLPKAGQFSYNGITGAPSVVINLSGHNGRGVAGVLLEEYVHGFLRSTIRAAESNSPLLSKQQRNAVTRLDALRRKFAQRMEAEGVTDVVATEGVSSLEEFIPTFLLDNDFQKLSRSVRDPNTKRSFFKRIIEAIGRFFGRDSRVSENAHNAAIQDIVELASKAPQVTTDMGMFLRRATTKAENIADRKIESLSNIIDMMVATARSTATNQQIAGTLPDPAEAATADESVLFTSSMVEDIPDLTEGEGQWMNSILQTVIGGLPRGIPFVEAMTTTTGVNVPVMAFHEGTVIINTAGLFYHLRGMSKRQATLAARTIIEEEVAHKASYNVLTNAEIDEIAESVSDEEFRAIIHSYYGSQKSIDNALEVLRSGSEEEIRSEKRRLIEEKLRAHAQKVTRGFTTEQDVAFYRTNPSLLAILKRYFRGLLNRMAARREMNKNNGPFNAALAAIHNELHMIQTGYRLDQARYHYPFNPNDPDEWFRRMEANTGQPFSDLKKLAALYGPELGKLIPEGGSLPLFSGLGADSGNAAAQAAFASGVDGEVDFQGMLEMLEIPMTYEGKAIDRKTWLRPFKGELDPRFQEFSEGRRFFNSAIGKTIAYYKEVMDKVIARDFPDGEIPHALINDATGNVGQADVPQDALEKIEDELDAAYLQIAADPAMQADPEAAEAARDLAREIRRDKIREAGKAVREEGIRKRDVALNKLAQLSPELATHISQIRNKLIEPLSKKVKELYNLEGSDLGIHIDRQMGIYVTRAYRAFNEPNYLSAVIDNKDGAYTKEREAAIKFFETTFVKDTAKALQREAAEKGVKMPKEEAKTKAKEKLAEENSKSDGHSIGEQAMYAFLRHYHNQIDGKRADSVETSKEPSARELYQNLISRRDIADPLQKLLGVYTEEDAATNLLRTLNTVGQMASNQAMLSHMKTVGVNNGFLLTAQQYHSNPAKYGDYVLLREAHDKSVNDPLAGLYVPRHLAQAINASFNVKSLALNADTTDKIMSKLGGAIRTVSGAAMAMKTLGSGGFYLRNYFGNYFFGLSQGYFPMGSMEKNIGLFFNKGKHIGKLAKYEALGIVGDELKGGVLKQMLTGKDPVGQAEAEVNRLLNQAKNLAKTTGKAGEKWNALVSKLGKAASAVDAIYKIAYFEHELGVLRKAKEVGNGDSYSRMTDTQLEQAAARNVLKTSQASSQASPLVRKITSGPVGTLFAPFVRFTADIVRIPINTVAMGSKEVRSGNPVIAARGVRRLAGLSAVMIGIPVILSTVVKALADISQEDEEALRKSLPTFLADHTFFYYRDAKNALHSIDLTYILPFSQWSDPFLRAFEKASVGDYQGAGLSFIKAGFSDVFLDDQILAGAVWDIKNNKHARTGRKIADVGVDGVGGTLAKQLEYVWENAFEPRVVTDAGKGVDAYLVGQGKEYGMNDALDPSSLFYKEHPAGIFLSGFLPYRDHTIDIDKSYRSYLYDKKEQLGLLKMERFALSKKEALTDSEIERIASRELEVARALNADILRTTRAYNNLGLKPQQTMGHMIDVGMGKRRVGLLTQAGMMERPVLTPTLVESMQKNLGSELAAQRIKKFQETMGSQRYLKLEED